ncbi:PilZ domain-containing protein [Cellulomonas sp. NS3]|uniref:PilZ domain-containing protein n=1 Tax=Cellulomonas sp. NS3 TaxID=2973977 RepID=UPI00216268F5|nr:PilZ domain-containing protein [Cellulomonas sp. NS3]
MHELSPCTIRAADDDVTVVGFVRALEGDTLTIGSEDIVRGLAVGRDVTVQVLDEVRGECLYAGFVSRVAGDQVDIADVDLVATLQKREVARVRTSVPCRGVVSRPAEVFLEGLDAADPTQPPGGEHELDFTVLDISAHGMRVLARDTVPVGSVIRFEFPELDAPFLIAAVVVRGQESRTGMHYGCRFEGTTAREADALFGYVMRTQGAQRRERLRI